MDPRLLVPTGIEKMRIMRKETNIPTTKTDMLKCKGLGI
jgi:hypothetical protein